jgi:hypothetical protein
VGDIWRLRQVTVGRLGVFLLDLEMEEDFFGGVFFCCASTAPKQENTRAAMAAQQRLLGIAIPQVYRQKKAAGGPAAIFDSTPIPLA